METASRPPTVGFRCASEQAARVHRAVVRRGSVDRGRRHAVSCVSKVRMSAAVTWQNRQSPVLGADRTSESAELQADGVRAGQAKRPRLGIRSVAPPRGRLADRSAGFGRRRRVTGQDTRGGSERHRRVLRRRGSLLPCRALSVLRCVETFPWERFHVI